MCSCSGEHAHLLQSQTAKTNIGQMALETVKCSIYLAHQLATISLWVLVHSYERHWFYFPLSQHKSKLSAFRVFVPSYHRTLITSIISSCLTFFQEFYWKSQFLPLCHHTVQRACNILQDQAGSASQKWVDTSLSIPSPNNAFDSEKQKHHRITNTIA